MCGWVKLNHDLAEVSLWREVAAFRLYLLLLMKAARKEGRMAGGIRLKQGQYLRAYSKLAEDLGYREGGRGEKFYSKSTIKRAVDKLVKNRLISVEETSIGSLFTLLNCEEIHKNGFVEFFFPNFHKTKTDQVKNESDSNKQQNQESEKKLEEKLEKKNDQTRVHQDSLPEENTELTARMNSISECFLQLRNRGTALSAKDINAIEQVSRLDVPLEKLLEWMKYIHLTNQQKSPHETIHSMSYYLAAILTQLSKSKPNLTNSRKETMKERIDRLERDGFLM